jgi:hypothetical protein
LRRRRRIGQDRSPYFFIKNKRRPAMFAKKKDAYIWDEPDFFGKETPLP